MSLRRDVHRALGLGWTARLDLSRAVVELGIARLRLLAPAGRRLGSGKAPPSPPPSNYQAQLIDRIAFAIPRMGARVPWKGTCLVQALAAQRWLARQGIASEIVLGTRKISESGIEAHAWLKAGDRIVVGGDPGDYQPFRPSRRT